MAYNATKILIGINVMVFLLVFSLGIGSEAFNGVFDSYSFSGGKMLEAWRWVTSLFLHASASHLFFNMLGLYFFGKVLESRMPRQWFLSIYFVAGLLGNLVFALTSTAPVVGASGAIFGLMGAAMLLHPTELINIYIIPLPLSIVAVLFVIVEAFVLYFQPSSFGNVATVAHVGGLVTGAVFAMFRSWKQSMKGIFIVGVSFALLIFLGPIFGFITGIGSLVLNFVDFAVGLVLYGFANALSFIWA
ncbi:MAG: rhomboid family intramembrane serine protease [Candidatus Aenigmarchaeota archaeon]|nr:rhomboid family intramembrane serine protease [Candidatus Aenigmarchaeota archaeon]